MGAYDIIANSDAVDIREPRYFVPCTVILALTDIGQGVKGETGENYVVANFEVVHVIDQKTDKLNGGQPAFKGDLFKYWNGWASPGPAGLSRKAGWNIERVAKLMSALLAYEDEGRIVYVPAESVTGPVISAVIAGTQNKVEALSDEENAALMRELAKDEANPKNKGQDYVRYIGLSPAEVEAFIKQGGVLRDMSGVFLKADAWAGATGFVSVDFTPLTEAQLDEYLGAE